MNSIKRWSIKQLHEALEELQDARASQHTALLEFRYGDYFSPTRDQLAWAKKHTRQNILHDIDDVMCEIERREPGTFNTFSK